VSSATEETLKESYEYDYQERVLLTGDSKIDGEYDFNADDEEDEDSEEEFIKLAARDGIITKHNPVMCGRRNAQRAENDFNGASGDLSHTILPNAVYNSLIRQTNRQQRNKVRVKETRDQARSETVLDQRTRLILLKLINNDVVSEFAGSLQSGKECNVYHAVQGGYVNPETNKKPIENCDEYAVKVFKTINDFKNADEYLEGETLKHWQRVKNHSSQRMSLWAEKELISLRRLFRVGLRCPRPVGLFGHVLLMEFIGKDGIPAPMLKDVKFADWDQLYYESITIMRNMWQKCKLVHADFSEYNILYYPVEETAPPPKDKLVFTNNLIVIDLATAVSLEHPRATEYLRRDIYTITRFFSRKGVQIFSLENLLKFITKGNLTDNLGESTKNEEDNGENEESEEENEKEEQKQQVAGDEKNEHERKEKVLSPMEYFDYLMAHSEQTMSREEFLNSNNCNSLKLNK
jgi:serine/threonine-protein kinase RIO1